MSGGSGQLTPIPIINPTGAAPGIAQWSLLALEEWRQIIGYHPYHFWQQVSELIPQTSNCLSVVRQYPYQNAQYVGRDSIRQAIQRAEVALANELRYSPVPHYREVTVPFPKFPKPDVQRLGYAGSDDHWISVQLPEGHIQAIGTEAVSVVQTNATVVYTDTNGDGVTDTFTVSIPLANLTGVEDVEIALYFNATDRFTGEGPSERWRIKPLTIRTSGVNKLISGPSWIMVRPILYEGFTLRDIDPNTPANFATSVDLYRHFTYSDGTEETTCEATLIWETPPYPQINYNINFNTTDPSGHAWAPARCTIRDKINGTVGFGESIYNSTTSEWEAVQWWASLYKFRVPDRVTIRYLAGYSSGINGEISPEYAVAVARLAAAELAGPICACDRANAELYRWQTDLARSAGGGDESYAFLPREEMLNPFGTRRGQVEAWQFVKKKRIITGFVP